MTAKRFKLSYPNGAFLIDGDKPLCSIENDLMIVDLLNELAEENKELKEKNKFILWQIRVFRYDCYTRLDFDGASTLNRLLDILREER